MLDLCRIDTGFAFSVSAIPCHHCYVLTFMLAEGEGAEVWKPSNKTVPFRISGE